MIPPRAAATQDILGRERAARSARPVTQMPQQRAPVHRLATQLCAAANLDFLVPEQAASRAKFAIQMLYCMGLARAHYQWINLCAIAM